MSHRAGASEAHPSSERTLVNQRGCVRRSASLSHRCRYLAVRGVRCSSNARQRPTGATRGNCCVPHASTALPPGDVFENGIGRLQHRLFGIPWREQQKLTPALGMKKRLYVLNHGFPRSRRMHALGHSHVCCTQHHAFESLNDPHAPSKLNNNRASPGFFGEKSIAMVLFFHQRDLELQIRRASRPLAAVDT